MVATLVVDVFVACGWVGAYVYGSAFHCQPHSLSLGSVRSLPDDKRPDSHIHMYACMCVCVSLKCVSWFAISTTLIRHSPRTLRSLAYLAATLSFIGAAINVVHVWDFY